MAGTNIVAKWSTSGAQFQSILRIAASVMFILSGTTKLLAFPAGTPPNGGTVELMSQLGFGAALEVFGGAFLLFGLFTRPVAFILAGEMAVAYFQFHFPTDYWPSINGGVSAALYCFIWLYFSAAGAGPWSLDAIRGRRRHPAQEVTKAFESYDEKLIFKGKKGNQVEDNRLHPVDEKA